MTELSQGSNTTLPGVHQPLLSVDSVVLRLWEKDLQILLVKRWNEPYAGMYAIPGVLLGTNESISEAAQRALSDKGEICPEDYRGCEQLRVFDETNRDPRGATISVTCMGFVTPDARTNGEWHNVRDLPALPFDHDKIVKYALMRLARPTEEFIWGVLGEQFTTGEYATLMEQLNVTVERSNLSRAIPARLAVQKISAKVAGRNQSVWSLTKWREANPL